MYRCMQAPSYSKPHVEARGSHQMSASTVPHIILWDRVFPKTGNSLFLPDRLSLSLCVTWSDPWHFSVRYNCLLGCYQSILGASCVQTTNIHYSVQCFSRSCFFFIHLDNHILNHCQKIFWLMNYTPISKILLKSIRPKGSRIFFKINTNIMYKNHENEAINVFMTL